MQDFVDPPYVLSKHLAFPKKSLNLIAQPSQPQAAFWPNGTRWNVPIDPQVDVTSTAGG